MAAVLALRPAGPEDENRLLNWRNDPSTREASFTQGEVAADEHRAWLARKLRDPGCALLIIEEDGRPLGQVRLDRLTADLADISIGLAPEARGRGLGRSALVLTAAEAPRLLGVATLRALVKHDNEQSLRAFRAAGFVEIGEVDGAVELRRQAGKQASETTLR